MLRNGVIFKVAIILLGLSTTSAYSMTKENFVEQLRQACKKTDKKTVKQLMQELDKFSLNNHSDAEEIKSSNNVFHIICRILNKAKNYYSVHNAKKILKLLLHNNFNPNAQDEKGNTPLHVLNPVNEYSKILKALIDYGANTSIKNNDQENPCELACKRKQEQEYIVKEKQKDNDYIEIMTKNTRKRWKNIEDHQGWQEDYGRRPKNIRKRYRFLSDLDENELQNSDGRIVFVIVHGTGFSGESGRNNKDYSDPMSESFTSFMDYAKAYVEQYNETQEQNKPKVLHLISFLCNGNLLDTTSRKPAGQELADYLESWNYRNSKIVCIAHSHGCNVVNFASNKLRLLKKKNNDLYKGRIAELIYFAPPCRQKITLEDEGSNLNPFEKIYDTCNDALSTSPTNYDQLFVFHSPNDHIVELGSIDALTALGVITTIGADGYYARKTIKKISEEGMPSTAEEQRDLLLGTLILGSASYAAYKSVAKKLKQAHTYNLSEPINLPKQVEGPKVHIETMVNGNYIGHSSPELLQNFATVLRILKTQYTLNVARCDNFKINIVTDQNAQEKLKQLIEHDPDFTLNSIIDDNIHKDQECALLTFLENYEDNCKIQCMRQLNEKDNNAIREKCNNSPYSLSKTKKLNTIRSKTIDENNLDSMNFANRSKFISNKNQLIYNHYSSEIQGNKDDVSSGSCNLL